MKKIVILAIALLVLLGIWYGVSKFTGPGGENERPVYATKADTLTISKVVVKRWQQPDIVMEKNADGFWMLTEPLKQRANQNLAIQLVRGMATMVFKDLVSNREAMQANFQIDELQAARLQAYDQDTLVADVYVGKTAPDMMHVYARKAGSDDIYTATGGGALSRFRTRNLDEFRDHSILDLDVALVDSTHIVAGKHDFTIARRDTTSWQMRIGDKGYKPSEKAPTEAILRSLTKLRASGFADDSTVIDWSKPAAHVNIWLLGRQPVELWMQPVGGDATDYWVKVAGDPWVYKVFESAFKAVDRDPETLYPSS